MILYVEDELPSIVPRITRLFSTYLEQKDIEELEAFEHDPDGYGATPEMIKQVVERGNMIEVEYRFPAALQKVLATPESYDLFIVDRNLANAHYTFEEVHNIDPTYKQQHQEEFHEREGDYLLFKLFFDLTHRIDIRTKFYFLTAYSAKDELRGIRELENLIQFNTFETENFIEKGDNTAIERLRGLINDNYRMRARHENRIYSNIVRTYLGQEADDEFIQMMCRQTDSGLPNQIRIMYEKILRACAEFLPGMEYACLDNCHKTILGSHVIEWLHKQHYISTVQRQFFFALKTITTEFSHPYHADLSKGSTLALILMLKDMILWFGKIRQKFSSEDVVLWFGETRQKFSSKEA